MPMEPITPQTVADQLTAYLHHERSLAELVDWAEQAMLDGFWAAEHNQAIRTVVSRLGVADVKAFGLTWEECESLLAQLGYTMRIEVQAQ